MPDINSIYFYDSEENSLFFDYVRTINKKYIALDSIQKEYYENPTGKLAKLYTYKRKEVDAYQNYFETESKGKVVNHFIIAFKKYLSKTPLNSKKEYYALLKENYLNSINFQDTVFFNRDTTIHTMKIVIQRVKSAAVHVDSIHISSIGKGLLVFLGISPDDSLKDVDYLVNKILHLRIFEDENGKMNTSVSELRYSVLVISQFTLYGDCRKGRRPSFTNTMKPAEAEKLYDLFVDKITAHDIIARKGQFGAHMDISLVNDGPVTFIIESI